jgi:hypothetical protein
MNDGERVFLGFYERYRSGAQSAWYRKSYGTYERAHRQSVTLTSFVLFLSSAVSILSVAAPRVSLGNGYLLAWSVLAAVLAATGTAIAAYRGLYGFQENAGIYRDADHALAAVMADSPDGCQGCAEATVRTPGEYVALVEQVFRREQGQWGQLVAQIRRTSDAEKDPEPAPQSSARPAGAAPARPSEPGEGVEDGGSAEPREPGGEGPAG